MIRKKNKIPCLQGISLISTMVAISILSISFIGTAHFRYYSALDSQRAVKHSAAARIAVMLSESWQAVNDTETYNPIEHLGSDLTITQSTVPEEAERYRIWKSIFPPEAPLPKDTDIKFMARQFKITGGNIKNIAISAAFLAAEDGGCINIENLIRATKREYQKMGKLCAEGEFAQYFELVKG